MSQIARGEVTTIEATARYVPTIGGQIQVPGVSGDDLYVRRGTVTTTA